ncbi:MAG: calcium/sodium antiporter [Schleiferiaceae bacterium]
MWTHLLFIVFGLVLLVFGGDWLVKASVSLALKLKVSTLVIGLTVVSFATSAPELIVSLSAALQGYTDISFGNVIGSNIANVGLILGVTAIIRPIIINVKSARFDLFFLILITLLFYGLVVFDNSLGHLEGLALLLALSGFIFYKIRRSRIEKKSEIESSLEVPEEEVKPWKMIAYFILGAGALRYGAMFLVGHSVQLALTLGVDERLISVTVLAFGTSVPELAASVIAAMKNESDIAFGNVVGSNLFNIGAVLGLTSVLTQIPVNNPHLFSFDYWWALGFSLLLVPLAAIGSFNKINRWEGGILLAAYFLYLFLIIK